MGISRFTLAIITLLAIVVKGEDNGAFDEFYRVQWGGNHGAVSHDRKSIELILDEYGGGAGFESKKKYLSGFFHIHMKVPENNSKGLITSYFLSSDRSKGKKHYELDFEFFGTKEEPYLNTNIFLNDDGFREQSIHLWFDPAKDFHVYEITWGVDIVVFFVDKIPIRIFKNYKKENIGFPTLPMKSEASIWNASWAGPVEWRAGPFRAQYKSFKIYGCSEEYGIDCFRHKFWWNNVTYTISPKQLTQYKDVQKKHLFYNYCTTDARKKECDLPTY